MTSTQISKNILGGLSQQPENSRQLNQARECDNAYLNPLEGAGKRMPTQHVRHVSGSNKTDRYMFAMDRDDEQYLIMCGGGFVNVYDKDGNDVPVRDTENSSGFYAVQTGAGSAGEYLGAGLTYEAGRNDLRSTVIVDTAFVVNRNVIVTEETGPTRVAWDVDKRTAGVFVRQFNWGTTLTVKIAIASQTLGNDPDEYEVMYSTGTNRLGYVPVATDNGNTRPFARIPFDRQGTVDDYYYILENNVSHSSNPTNIFQEPEPFVDSATELFADETAVTSDKNCAFGYGSFTYNVGTRVARIVDTSVTAPPTLYFGIRVPGGASAHWDDPQGSNSGGGTYSNVSNANNSGNRTYARSYPINTEYVSHRLRELLVEAIPAGDISVLPAIRTGGSSFLITSVRDIVSFSVTDGVGNSYATGWTSEVEDITDLPLEFRHGALVYISGEEGVTDAGYYARFSSTKWAQETDRDFDQFDRPEYNDHFGAGLWLEAALPETGKGKLTKNTMPVMIRRTVDVDNGSGVGLYTGGDPGDIFFDVRFTDEWGERTVGSTKNNKAPSFVGKPIREIFYWQGRLGFTSEDNVIMSQTAELYNFWRTTQLSVPDDARIDIASTEGGGRTINYVVPMNERLLTFTQDTQVVIGSKTGVLSPRTVEAPVVSHFEGLAEGPPVPLGRSVLMPYRNAAYVGLRELIPFGELNNFAPVDLTQNVPRLIEQNSNVRIAANPNDSILFVHTAEKPQSLYTFKYLKQSDTEYSFAGWSEWKLSGEVQDLVMLNETLYLVMFYENGGQRSTSLEKIEFGPGQTDEGSDLLMHLDRKKYFSGSGGGITATFTAQNQNYGGLATTTYTFSTPLTYDPDSSPTFTAVTAKDGAIAAGTELTVLDRNSNSLVVRGVPINTKLWFGVPYTFKWSANRVLPRVQDGTPMHGRRTINSEARVNFDRSRYFTIVLEHKAGNSYTTTFDNNADSSIGIGPVEGFAADDISSMKSGTLRIPMHGASHNLRMSILNDSPFPSNITGIEWVSTQNRQSGVSGVF